MTIAGGNITVASTDGDHQLGGGDWDERLVRFFASRFEAEHAADGAAAGLQDTDPRPPHVEWVWVM